MKKGLLILLNLIIMFSLTGCNKANEKFIIKKSAELNEVNGVTMTIKKGTLNESGATIIITDKTGKENIYGQEYRIDKFENNNWKEMDIILNENYGWILLGYRVDKDNKLEMQINWEWLYGKLDSGEYRIVKFLGNSEKKYFSVEFTIK